MLQTRIFQILSNNRAVRLGAEGSGLHRYVFLLYKQPGAEPLAFEGVPRLTNTSAEHRAGFNARAFAKLYGLRDPVAARVFQAPSPANRAPHVRHAPVQARRAFLRSG